MLLSNDSGERFEMRVVDYQFPKETKERWDANWLMLEVSVKHKDGEWKKRDPFLLTWELKRLITWLEKLAASESDGGNIIDFLEPNIVFEYLASEGSPLLRVYFEVELRPPWVPIVMANMRDIYIDFELDRLDLTRAAASLKREAAAFPERVV